MGSLDEDRQNINEKLKSMKLGEVVLYAVNVNNRYYTTDYKFRRRGKSNTKWAYQELRDDGNGNYVPKRYNGNQEVLPNQNGYAQAKPVWKKYDVAKWDESKLSKRIGNHLAHTLRACLEDQLMFQRRLESESNAKTEYNWDGLLKKVQAANNKMGSNAMALNEDNYYQMNYGHADLPEFENGFADVYIPGVNDIPAVNQFPMVNNDQGYHALQTGLIAFGVMELFGILMLVCLLIVCVTGVVACGNKRYSNALAGKDDHDNV